MKSLTKKLMFAAAALVVGSSAAMAADVVVFTIPFAFQAAGKTMTPGTYEVRSVNSAAYFTLSNARSGESVYVNARGPHDPKKEWTAQNLGVMQFACGDNGCTMTELWTGDGQAARYISNPGVPDGKSTHLALIRASNSR